MDIPETDYKRIAEMIHSDTSPVGIDAKKTHIMLLYMVEQLQQQIAEMEARLTAVESDDDA